MSKISSDISDDIKKFIYKVMMPIAKKNRFYTGTSRLIKTKRKPGQKKSSHAATVLNTDFKFSEDCMDEDKLLSPITVNENFPTTENADDLCAERRHPFLKASYQTVSNCQKTDDLVMIVIRYHFGEFCLGNSAPCSKCSDALKKSGIKNIIYSNANGDLILTKTDEYKTEHVTVGTQIQEQNDNKSNNNAIEIQIQEDHNDNTKKK